MNAVWRVAAGLLLVGPPIVHVAAAPAPARKAAAPTADNAPCAACHGMNGEGSAAAHVPRIAGQSAEYLAKQLEDYASGARDNPIMANFAKPLSAEQRQEYARRYAAMTAPFLPAAASGAKQLARGHQLAYQGDEAIRVQACNSCHGPDGAGVLHAAPYLAGQSAEYIASALQSFKSGARRNDAGELMRSVAARLGENDITAAAAYFAGEGPATH